MNTYQLQYGPLTRAYTPGYDLATDNNLAALTVAQELAQEDGVVRVGRYPQLVRVEVDGSWTPISGPDWILDGLDHPEVANY